MPPKRKTATTTAASKKAKVDNNVGIPDPQVVAHFSSSSIVPQVYVSPTGDIMDVLLVQLDLKTNTDKYYVLQLVADPASQASRAPKYFCFARWGRTGSKGQSQFDGPHDLTDAVDAFEKKFLDKTGNDWSDRHAFSLQGGKYNLMKVDHAQKALNAANTVKAVWEYYVDDKVDGKANGWYPFTQEGAENAEELWVIYQSNGAYSQRIVLSGTYDYLIDLVLMTQKNASLPTARIRQIRRSYNGIVTVAANAGGGTATSSSSSSSSAPVTIAAPAPAPVAAVAPPSPPAVSTRPVRVTKATQAKAAAEAAAALVSAAAAVVAVAAAAPPVKMTKAQAAKAAKEAAKEADAAAAAVVVAAAAIVAASSAPAPVAVAVPKQTKAQAAKEAREVAKAAKEAAAAAAALVAASLPPPAPVVMPKKVAAVAPPAPPVAAAKSAGTRVRPVDPACQISGNGTVVVGDMDVTLNKVAIAKNENKFYRIQLLQRGGAYYVWTRWGRVGEVGQSALLGSFSTLDRGEAEFGKKFKDKSGSKWEDKDNFVSRKDKYDLIATKEADDEPPAPVAVKGPAIHPSQYPPSKLALPTQHFINLILDQDMFKNTMAELNIDVKRMPLGALSDTQIAKGFAVLEKVKALLVPTKEPKPEAPSAAGGAKRGRGKKAAAADDDDDEDDVVPGRPSASKLEELSSEFYTVIPHSYPRHIRPPILNSVATLEAKFDMLSTLKDIAVAQGVLSSSDTHASLTAHPIDTKYAELHSALDLLDASHPHHPIISRYVTETMGYHKIKLQNVWSLRREPEDQSFREFTGLDNHRLLWHGTNVAVVAAILKTGLRIMPTVNGGRVGRGIYMANELEKSASYVRPTSDGRGGNIGILFLVEAALGKMNIITRDNGSLRAAPAGFNSVLAQGTQSPDPAGHINIDIDGTDVSVPQTKGVQQVGVNSNFHNDEYLIYNEHQQRLRYVLTFKF